MGTYYFYHEWYYPRRLSEMTHRLSRNNMRGKISRSRNGASTSVRKVSRYQIKTHIEKCRREIYSGNVQTRVFSFSTFGRLDPRAASEIIGVEGDDKRARGKIYFSSGTTFTNGPPGSVENSTRVPVRRDRRSPPEGRDRPRLFLERIRTFDDDGIGSSPNWVFCASCATKGECPLRADRPTDGVRDIRVRGSSRSR